MDYAWHQHAVLSRRLGPGARAGFGTARWVVGCAGVLPGAGDCCWGTSKPPLRNSAWAYTSLVLRQATSAVLGYVELPDAAHRTTFEAVRALIDECADRSEHSTSLSKPLKGVPGEYVFVRGGAPVGRKQEARFTVAATEGDAALIVLRDKKR